MLKISLCTTENDVKVITRGKKRRKYQRLYHLMMPVEGQELLRLMVPHPQLELKSAVLLLTLISTCILSAFWLCLGHIYNCRASFI